MQRTICGTMRAMRRGVNAYPTCSMPRAGRNPSTGLNARSLQ
jgi:hypothetical protein